MYGLSKDKYVRAGSGTTQDYVYKFVKTQDKPITTKKETYVSSPYEMKYHHIGSQQTKALQDKTAIRAEDKLKSSGVEIKKPIVNFGLKQSPNITKKQSYKDPYCLTLKDLVDKICFNLDLASNMKLLKEIQCDIESQRQIHQSIVKLCQFLERQPAGDQMQKIRKNLASIGSYDRYGLMLESDKELNQYLRNILSMTNCWKLVESLLEQNFDYEQEVKKNQLYLDQFSQNVLIKVNKLKQDANKSIQEPQISKKYTEEVSDNYALYNKMKSAQSKQRSTSELHAEIAKLQKKKEQLELQIKSLDDERVGRQNDLNKMSKEMERVREEEKKFSHNKIPSSRAYQTRDEKKPIFAQYQGQIERLVTERSRIESQLKAKKKQTDQLQQKNNNLKLQHSKLIDQVNTMTRQLNSMKNEGGSLRQLTDQRNQLMAQNKALETEKNSHAEQLKTITQELENKRKESREFKQKQKDNQEVIRQMSASIRVKDEHIDKLQRQLQHLKQQNDKAKRETNRWSANQQRLRELQQKNQQLETKITQLTRRQAELKDFEKQTKQAIERETRQINDLRRQNKELEDKVRVLAQQREADRKKNLLEIHNLEKAASERDKNEAKQKHYNNTLEAEINQLKSQNKQLQNQLQEEKQRIRDLNTNLSNKNKQVNNINASLVKQQLENQRYVARANELENMIYQLEKEKAEIVRENVGLAEEAKNYRQQNNRLLEQNRQVSQGRSSLFEDKTRSSNQIKALSEETHSLKRQLEEYKQGAIKIEQEKKDILNTLEQTRRNFESEIKSRQRDSSSSRQAHQAQVQQLKQQVDKLQSELKNYIDENNNLKNQLQQHKQTITQFYNENRSVHENLLFEQSERYRLQKQLQSLRGHLNTLTQNDKSQQQQQARQLQRQQQEARQRALEIQRLNKDYRRQRQQKQALIQQFNTAQQHSERLTAQNKQLEGRIESLTASNQDRLQEQQNRLKQKHDQVSRLSLELSSARNEVREKEEALSKMRQSVYSFEKQVASLSENNELLNIQIEQDRKKHQHYSQEAKQIMQQNQRERNRMRSNMKNLQDNLNRATQRNTQAEGLERELSQYKTQANKYKNQNRELITENQQQRSTIQKLEQQLKLLQSGNGDIAKRFTQAETEIQSLRYSLQEKQKHIVSLNRKTQNLNAQITASRRATEQNSQKIRIKEDQLKIAQTQLKSLKEYSERQITSLKEYKQQKDKTDEIYHQNQKMLQQNLEKLKGEYLVLHKKHQMMSQEKETLQKKAGGRSQDNLAYVQSLQKINSQNQELIKELTASNRQLSAKIQAMDNKPSPSRRHDLEKTQLQNEVFKLKQEVNVMKEQLSAKEKQLSMQGQKIKVLETQCNSLKRQHRKSANEQGEVQMKNKVELQRELSPKREEAGSQLSVEHLFHGDVLRGLNDYKSFIKESIQKRSNVQIVDTKMIYQYDELNKINIHKYIDNKEQIVLIIQLGNEAEIQQGKRKEDYYYVAAYFEGCLKPKTASDKDGIIMSLNNRKCYYPLEKNKKATVYDEYFVIFGNSQVRIKSQEKKVFSNFGLNSSYYKHDGDTVSILFGKSQREVPFIHCEVHQLILK